VGVTGTKGKATKGTLTRLESLRRRVRWWEVTVCYYLPWYRTTGVSLAILGISSLSKASVFFLLLFLHLLLLLLSSFHTVHPV
jgi:hypothetical protein